MSLALIRLDLGGLLSLENRFRWDTIVKSDVHFMFFVEDKSLKGWLVINNRFDFKLDFLDHCIGIVIHSDAFWVFILRGRLLSLRVISVVSYHDRLGAY